MSKKLLKLLVATAAMVTVLSTGIVASAAGTYTVQSGDTLSKISKQAYGTTKEWKVIYEVNQAIIKDPNLIYPGQVITIPDWPVGSVPATNAEASAASAAAAAADASAATPVPTPAPAPVTVAEEKTVNSWVNDSENQALVSSMSTSEMAIFLVAPNSKTVSFQFKFKQQIDLSGVGQAEINQMLDTEFNAQIGIFAEMRDVIADDTQIDDVVLRIEYLNADGSLIYSRDFTK